MTRGAGLLTGALAGVLAGAACFSEHGPTGPAAMLTCERAGQPAGPDSAFVIVRGFAFEPAELRVAPGTRVVWINCEAAGTPGHTTTAMDGTWDSPTLLPGESFSVVAEAGNRIYHCRPHPFMGARLIVE